MTIREILIQGTGILSRRSTPRLDSELILGFVLGLSREQLFSSSDKEVEDADIERYLDFIDEVNDGRPVSYITHEKEFYGRSFYVDGRVLIPRPETEMLVEQVIRLSKDLPSPLRILDVGTGSGCIGLTLALEMPESLVTVADISKEALDVVYKNLVQHGIEGKVTVVESDLLSNLLDQGFDIIVANLPYIGEEKFHFVAKDVDGYEPHVALYGGSDGLQLYKKMFQQMESLPVAPRYMLGEFGFAQSDDMRLLLNTFFEHKSSSISILPDLAGIDRVFIVSFL